MPIEIERKFLINESILGELKVGTVIRQGYLPVSGNLAVRARIKGNKGYITIKGPQKGAVRSEYEYEIPVTDAEEIINNLCGGLVIEKTRYILKLLNHVWEIDVFEGANKGLIVAEVEIKSENEIVELPAWIKKEVTRDHRYSNSNLVKCPYSTWDKQ